MTKKLLVAGLLTVASFGVGGLVTNNALAAPVVSNCVDSYYTVEVDATNYTTVKLPGAIEDNGCGRTDVVKISGAAGHLKELNFKKNYGEKLEITVTSAGNAANVAELIKKLFNAELNSGTTVTFTTTANFTGINEKHLGSYNYSADEVTLAATDVFGVYEFVLAHPNVTVKTFAYTGGTITGKKANNQVAAYANNVVLNGAVLTVNGDADGNAVLARLASVVPNKATAKEVTKLVINAKTSKIAVALSSVKGYLATLKDAVSEIELNIPNDTVNFTSLQSSLSASVGSAHVTLNVKNGSLTINAKNTPKIENYTISVYGTVTIRNLAAAGDNDAAVWKKLVDFTRGNITAAWYEVDGLSDSQTLIAQRDLNANTYVSKEAISGDFESVKDTGDYAVYIEIGKYYDPSVEVYVGVDKLRLGTDYTVKEGSTIVIFNPDYIEKLATGNYDVEIKFADGQIAKAQFAVVQTKNDDNSGGDGGGSSGGKGGNILTGVDGDEDGDKTPNTGVALSGDDSAAVAVASADLTSAFGLISGIVGAIGISIRRLIRR
jgi:hypothetical protein